MKVNILWKYILVLLSLTINEPYCVEDLPRKAKSRVVFGVLRAVLDNSLTFCANPQNFVWLPRQQLLLKLIQPRWSSCKKSKKVNDDDGAWSVCDVILMSRWESSKLQFPIKRPHCWALRPPSRPSWCTLFMCHKVQGPTFYKTTFNCSQFDVTPPSTFKHL